MKAATTEQMRAMVHPLRMRILDALRNDGPSTASRLAAALGESSGAMSYHLRVLANTGVVEEVPGRGNGRERWWQRAAPLYTPTDAEGPDERALVLATRAMQMEREDEAVRRFLHAHDDLPVEWRRAAFSGSRVVDLTADDLLEFGLEYLERLERLGRRGGPPPQGARRVVIGLRAVPWIGDDRP